MRRAHRCFVLIWICTVAPAGVRAQDSPRFEAVTVRPSGPPPAARGGRGGYAGPTINGGPGTADPGRINYTRMSMLRLLFMAYQVQPDQISGPSWINTELFDVSATLPPGTAEQQMRVMLQNLLIDRFKLAFHRVSREFPAYELTVVKGGPKFKEAVLSPGEKLEEVDLMALDPRKDLDSNGYLVIPAGRAGIAATRHDGGNFMTCRACTIAKLIQQLSVRIAVPTGDAYTPVRIVDGTKLTGNYDFHLQFAGGFALGGLQPPPLDSQADQGPDLLTALDRQLGLKLDKTKVSMDALVVDHIERMPIEN